MTAPAALAGIHRFGRAAAVVAQSPAARLALRAIPFLGLCAFATMHWSAMVEPAPTGRGLLIALIATASGVLIAASERVPLPAGTLARVAILIVGTALAVAAIGIRFRLVLPGGWGTLSDRVTGGLTVVDSVAQWPYAGPNSWLRSTTLLAAPIVAMLAAALAFWPSRHSRPRFEGLRFLPLALLVALYCVAVAARDFGSQGLRGLGLLAAIAAWLWLPRLRGRNAAGAAVAVAAAGLIGLGLTGTVASSQPWIDYHAWSWSVPKQRAIAFDWNHSYGPLHWPRKGTTLLLVKSKHPHYWRAETLDRFDGFRWVNAPNSPVRPAEAGTLRRKAWTETVDVTVRGLRSQVLVGPGTIVDIAKQPHQTISLSDATYVVDGELASGDSYTATGFVPDPSVREMRAAPPTDPAMTASTRLSLPPGPGFQGGELNVPLRGSGAPGSARAGHVIERSPYGRMYRLATRVTAGATTDYDVVKRINAWLEGHYGYRESVPPHRYPLISFVFGDRAGYCQQFSGAAALMLRMLGIPTRIASGFTPGTLNSDTHEYVVRDLDAHSWIEVWFQGIGWVPFDPTPALAPASSRASIAAPSAARGDNRAAIPKGKLDRILGIRPESAAAGGVGSSKSGRGLPWGVISLVTMALVLLVSGIVAALHRRRSRQRPVPPSCGDAAVDHLILLLTRAGLDVHPGTTLFGLEQRLERLGGPQLAGYVRRLRECRFGVAGAGPPLRGDRRKLRRDLALALEAGPITRLHLALPNGPIRRMLGIKLAQAR